MVVKLTVEALDVPLFGMVLLPSEHGVFGIDTLVNNTLFAGTRHPPRHTSGAPLAACNRRKKKTLDNAPCSLLNRLYSFILHVDGEAGLRPGTPGRAAPPAGRDRLRWATMGHFISSVVENGDALAALWHGGAETSLPFLWLRDNCGCSECRVVQTTEKRFHIFRVARELRPRWVAIECSGLRRRGARDHLVGRPSYPLSVQRYPHPHRAVVPRPELLGLPVSPAAVRLPGIPAQQPDGREPDPGVSEERRMRAGRRSHRTRFV